MGKGERKDPGGQRGHGALGLVEALARPGEVPEAPLPYLEKRLVWNETKGARERDAACDKPKGKLSFN
jgi:hypothetical protein